MITLHSIRPMIEEEDLLIMAGLLNSHVGIEIRKHYGNWQYRYPNGTPADWTTIFGVDYYKHIGGKALERAPAVWEPATRAMWERYSR